VTSEEIKSLLKDKKVGIAGCGGLGSNCAIALARAGVGTLVVADFDVITESNLNRQYFFYDQIGLKKAQTLQVNINRINPFISVIALDIKLTPQNIPIIFSGCDAVVEAFDLATEKEMLIETMLLEFPSIPLVTGLGIAGWGNNELIHYRQIDNLHICGDETIEIGIDHPPMAPRVGIVANMQANVVVEILLKEGKTVKR
jgi:sulfur carrier protein ThiS adenylyltransferase